MHEDGETAHPPPGRSGRGGTASPGPGKAETIRRLHILKKRIAILAVLGFGVLSGLVAGHHGGAAAQSSPAAPTATTVPTPVPSTDQGNGFFDQGGASNQGGYSVGAGSGTQAPVAGSGAS